MNYDFINPWRSNNDHATKRTITSLRTHNQRKVQRNKHN